MKVTFIQPPVEDFYSTPVRRQPLGLLYLAGIAHQAGWETTLINGHSPKKKMIGLPAEFDYLKPWMDFPESEYRFPFKHYYHFGLSDEEIIRQIRQNPSDLFAVSSLFTPYFEETSRILNFIRKIHPHSTIIVGGPHVSLYPNYFLDLEQADYAMIGEAEGTFAQFLTALKGNDSSALCSMPNLLSRSHRQGKTLAPPVHINQIPFPQRDLLKDRDFKFYKTRGVSLIYSRGCPNSCSFCTSRFVFGSGYRQRQIESILEEIDLCVKNHQVRVFNFEDDNLFQNSKKAVELLENLIHYQERNNIQLDFTAMNGVSIESMNKNILRLMKQAGFKEINLSLVTASLINQKKLSRPFDTLRFSKIAQFAKEMGFNIRAYFILGLPFQTREEIEETLKFLKQLQIKAVPSVFYNVTIPDPNQWKIQRSSAFANETEHFSRKQLLYYFNKTIRGDF